jgi:hypothetical protein
MMSKTVFWDRVRDKVAALSFSVFLWAMRMTEDEYRKAVAEDFNRDPY